jgi:hypothetical protein
VSVTEHRNRNQPGQDEFLPNSFKFRCFEQKSLRSPLEATESSRENVTPQQVLTFCYFEGVRSMESRPGDAADQQDATALHSGGRELELELIRVRAEAKLVRLEARAAEIELLLRRQTRLRAEREQIESNRPDRDRIDSGTEADHAAPDLDYAYHPAGDSASTLPHPASEGDESAAIFQGIDSWDAFLQAVGIPRQSSDQTAAAQSSVAEFASPVAPRSNSPTSDPIKESSGRDDDDPRNGPSAAIRFTHDPHQRSGQQNDKPPQSRRPIPERTVDQRPVTTRPKKERAKTERPNDLHHTGPSPADSGMGARGDRKAKANDHAESNGGADLDDQRGTNDGTKANSEREAGLRKSAAGKTGSHSRISPGIPAIANLSGSLPLSQGSDAAGLGGGASMIDTDRPQTGTRRRRPAAVIFSILSHAAVLVLLAGITLTVREPRDQIALSARTAEPAEQTVESVEMQQQEAPEVATAAANETVATTLSVNDVAASVVDVSGPPSPPALAVGQSLLNPMLGASIDDGMPSGDLSTTFFGASGGGNHFVYLVDSSGSMDQISPDGFDVARAEVLRAVDSLTDRQRFYVVFFGKETLRMRLGDSDQPPPRAVYATDENKAALQRWAMTLSMQAGRWPEEALEIAFELRPDCIFLLTDGAMPDYVPEMVERNNIVETLLDGPKPRSIIHTIGFHNPEGEAILRKIAKQNGGQYHFVPPPRRVTK